MCLRREAAVGLRWTVPARVRAARLLTSTNVIIPAPVTTEIDYLFGRWIGRATRLAFLDDLAAGRIVVESLELDKLSQQQPYDAAAVEDVIEALANEPRPPGCTPLQGYAGVWRIRDR